MRMTLSFCSLSSGSQGNCYVIRTEKTGIIIDAGISAKKINEGLLAIGTDIKQIQAVLFTHEHRDHTMGIKTLAKKYGKKIYANEQTWEASNLDVQDENKMFFTTGEDFKIGDIKVRPFSIFHDAVEPVGFSLFHDGRQISTLTDTGHISDEMVKEIVNADILVLEANHDVNMLKIGRYPWFLKQRILGRYGHLSNEDAGGTLRKIVKMRPKNRQVLLAHLSNENNFPQMAYQTVKNILEEDDFYIGKHFIMDTIVRDEISAVYST